MDDTSAQMLAGGLMFAVVVVALAIGIAINVVICLILSKCLQRVPPEHRQQQPGMVWLLLIPCFNFIWNFFVHPKIAASFKSYFNSVGRTDVGDCGGSLALTYSILTVCSIIPYLGILAGLASLVLLIIWIVKANELKNQIPLDASGPNAIAPVG